MDNNDDLQNDDFGNFTKDPAQNEHEAWNKYKKYFAPVNCYKGDDIHHVDNGGFLNIIFFLWIYPLVRKGMRKTLEIDDLNVLPEQMKSQQTLKKLKYYLNKEYEQVGNKEKISLFRVYFNLCFSKLLMHLCSYFVAVTSGFIGTLVIARYLFEYLEGPTQNTSYGCMLAISLILASFMRMVGMQNTVFLGFRIGCYAKSAFLSLVYEKALKLKSSGTKSTGELINLCANDVTRILEFSSFCGSLIVTPITITWVVVYLTLYIGPVILVGFAVLFLYLPFSVLIGYWFTHLRKKTVGYSDKRVKMISEALTFVKLIKMYAWEKPFSDVVYELRKKEKHSIQWMAFVESMSSSISFIIGSVAPVITIIVAVYIKEEINISKAFILVAIYSLIRSSIKLSQDTVRRLAEVIVSFNRIKEFLNMEEKREAFKKCVEEENAIEMDNASFTWGKILNSDNLTSKENSLEKIDEMPEVEIVTGEKNVLLKETCEENENEILKNITINVKKKSLVGICGPVASGKSSFLQALLNEMDMLSGRCAISSSFAYVPQQPWIMSTTIRENILFGKDYDSNLFKNVCSACALEEDLQSMPSGDLTEVGERGITLSGGQKQRVSLARALYAGKELYLLDDPLSAVDANVGKHIFQNCIQKSLKGSTVILVTHQLQYLQDCDYVIYMKDGSFFGQGTYGDLLKENATFAAEIEQYRMHHKNDSHDVISSSVRSQQEIRPIERLREVDVITEKLNEKELLEKGQIVQAEDKKDGAVTLATYHSFIKFCGGYVIFLFVTIGIGSSIVLQIIMDYWLSMWLRESDVLLKQLKTNSTNSTGQSLIHVDYDSKRDYYMTIYCALAASVIVTALLFSFLNVIVLLHGSTRLHNIVFEAIFTSPMSFFDTTPSGRILNRLGKDVDEIDHKIPLLFRSTIFSCSHCIGLIVFISISIPYFLIVFFIMVILFGLINVVYRRVVRAIKRVENVTRSPVYSHFTETSQGLMTIRSYNKEKLFTDALMRKVDCNIGPLIYFYGTTRWFGTSVDTLCTLSGFFICLTVVLLKEQIAPTVAVMCVTYGINMFGLVQLTFRMLADLEARFTSVERLDHFVNTLKPEGRFVTKEKKLTENWPRNGSIEFSNVSLRYRESLPLVLKDMSVKINDKEKIGIVGRTGAGKSTITVALYRLVNPQNGVIKIDGIDTKNVGLTDLRSNLTIIPQDPVLFIGSIRYNLDPFQQYDDNMLWNSLEKAHIKELISNLPLKLESPVQEHGSNFSVGERQLICMARALLRKTKILVLDEATASIDSSSDFKIQETIRECFDDCTVLTIAHRLNTIMDSDKVIVMTHGQVVEYDTPSVLLSKDSLFRRMRTTAGMSQG